MRVEEASSNTLYYLLSDYLGSTSVIADANGALVARQGYLPYGGQRYTQAADPNAFTSFDFTGQRLDPTGLHLYQARYYASALGRFVSADSIVPEPGDPQALNRYTYANNSPLRYTDPSGHCVFGVDTIVCLAVGGALIGAGIGYGAQAYGNLQAGMDLPTALTTDIDPGKVVAGVFLGGAGGAALPAGAALGGAALTAAGLTGAATTAGTLACGDGDCLNEARAAAAAACGDGDCTNEAGAAAQAVRGPAGQFARFWNRVTSFQGTRVYQRDDLIDPGLVDRLGRSNLQRMQAGVAPIGPDRNSLQLHHMLQTAEGPLAEVTQTFHQQYSRILHINPSAFGSGIDRYAFDAWRRAYWMHRAEGLIAE